VHEEEFDIAGVVDEESLVAGGHHMSGLLVGSETNLQIPNQCCPCLPQLSVPRTEGITIWPLKRRRTLLSIPFGFLQPDLNQLQSLQSWKILRRTTYWHRRTYMCQIDGGESASCAFSR
jgi:hypothetical protein